MTGGKKIYRLVFVAIFLSVISAPLLGKVFHVGAIGAEDFAKRENRHPNDFPGLPISVTDLKEYPSLFESAFNDHLPFRDFLVKWYGNLTVQLLGVSPNRQLLIGKDGHFFLASHSDGDNDLIFSSIEIDPQRLKQWTDHLKRNESFLSDLNAPVLILAIPISPLLEFQYLPTFIQKQIDRSFLTAPPPQRVMEQMSGDFRDKYLLFPYRRVIEANREYPLFGEKNFHWRTSRYTKLVASCIAERFGIADYEKPGFDEFEKQQTVSDLSRFAGIDLYNRDDLVYKDGFWESLGIRDQNPAGVYKNYPVFPFSFYTVNHSKTGKLLLVGDSFTPALRFDLARHFGEVLSVNFMQARKNQLLEQWFDCVFGDIRPGYIVFSNHNVFLVYKEFVDSFYHAMKDLQASRVAEKG